MKMHHLVWGFPRQPCLISVSVMGTRSISTFSQADHRELTHDFILFIVIIKSSSLLYNYMGSLGNPIIPPSFCPIITNHSPNSPLTLLSVASTKKLSRFEVLFMLPWWKKTCGPWPLGTGGRGQLASHGGFCWESSR